MGIPCPSRICRVTVHARGALVTRLATPPAALPDGPLDLVVDDLSPLAEPGSVRAALPGSSRAVVSLGAALHLPASPLGPGPTVEQRREVEARIERLDGERSRLAARVERLRRLRFEPRLALAGQREEADQRLADALAAGSMLDQLVAGLDERLVRLDEVLRDLEQERRAAELADAHASSEARQGAGHPRRTVTVRIDGEGAVPCLEITYVVPAARWWPVYTLRLDDGGRRGSWWLEALVAQASGEDWNEVGLGLSTADLVHDARLPELPSLRLGRSQPPPRRGYRLPPEGLDRLFVGYERAFPHPAAPPPTIEETTGDLDFPAAEGLASIAEDLEAEEPTAVQALPPPSVPPPLPRTSGRAAFAPGAPPPASMAAPAPPAARGGGGGRLMDLALPPSGGFPSDGGLQREESSFDEAGTAQVIQPQVEPADAFLDFDELSVGEAGERGQRGRLIKRATAPLGEGLAAELRLERLVPPLPVRDPRESRGLFDHRYDASGAIEVPADGLAHRVLLGRAEAPATLRFRTVPREAQEVYREAELGNPFPGPLLAGPVDVYVEGSLLLTTTIEHIDRGGTLTVGLGVEERLRVARNVRVEEETAGLLGGSTVVDHDLTIDLASSLGREVTVELLERLPVSDDKGAQVELVAARPEAQPYDQAERGQPVRGGLRWRIDLPPGGKRTVELAYRITLPSKSEIVGGNRRD